jgi:PAS domain S-box-containing protein
MKSRRTYVELEAELKAAKIRLEEAEETLRAIQSNEVDALVIEGPQGQQIYTLKGAEQTYRTLMETMSEGALTVAADGTILYCNNRFSELLKMPLNRMIGESLYYFVRSANEKMLEVMLRECGRDGCRGEFFLKTSEEAEVPVLISARSLVLGDAVSFCLVATDLTEQKRIQASLEKTLYHLEARVAERTAEISQVNVLLQAEITERKKSEEALRDSERLYRAIGESIDYGVWVCAPDGRNIYASKSFLEMVGINQEQCSNFGWGDVLHPDDAESTIASWKECVETGGTWDMEHRFRGVDGQWHPVLARGVPVKNEHSEIIYWAGINLDISRIKQAEETLQRTLNSLELRVQERITELSQAYEKLQYEVEERRKTEAQLLQSQKMEAMGTLAGGIAHDFNNILAAIIGFSEMVEEDLPPESPSIPRIQRVLSAASRGRELVRQILAFSRKTETARTPLSLFSLVQETVQLLRASLPTTIEIKLSTKADRDTVLASPAELQQILMNLATNASFAMMETGGILDISITNVDFEPDSPIFDADIEPGQYVQLVVTDTGSGMAPDVMKRIFEPFFTTREVGEGTGLGLAVVYGIVKSLHGTITVKSELGVGSVFRVFLPKVATEVQPESAKTVEIPRGKERVLFIDDEELLVEWGQALLERLGYEVTALTDSAEAFDIFSSDPSRFDLVITDQTMPHMTGLRLARELLKIRPNIPIILCTGHSDAVTPHTLKEAGVREFMLKPLAKRELSQAVRRVLEVKPEA